MDFLLECVGFPPDEELEPLIDEVRARGEPVAWRGGGDGGGTHLRLPLVAGIELRLDQCAGEAHPSLWPYFASPHRLRVAYQGATSVPGAPYDVLLHGIANPPLPDDAWGEATGMEYALATFLSDGRRLPRDLALGHVLAVSLAGFALDVSYLGPNQGVRDRNILEEPRGALLVPCAGADAPGGAMDLSLRIRTLRQVTNPLTGLPIQILEADAPGRPLELFVSPWQLAADGLGNPHPGHRIEGSFLFSGRLAGGLPRSASPRRAVPS